MKTKNIKKLTLGLALAGVVGLAGISAYFADTDTATNSFTVGKVSHVLEEPSWDDEDPTHDNIEPGGEFAKDPQVRNDGENDQYVFLTVTVPYADNLIVSNDDGSKQPAAETDLFSYTVNEGWTQLGAADKDEDAKTKTYTYYYGSDDTLTALTKGQTTAKLFDKIQFCNAVEGQSLETTAKDVVVNSYGIQTSNLGGSDVNEKTPAGVWAIVQNAYSLNAAD